MVTIMPGASIASQVRRAASRFPGDNQGNIAVLFGIALLPILGFMGRRDRL
jgi:Flp pilus assembly protein TadG